MKKSNRHLGGETVSVIFSYDPDDFLRAHLPNGKAINPDAFHRVIFAHTNFPMPVCERLAVDICDGEVSFPFYLNVTNPQVRSIYK